MNALTSIAILFSTLVPAPLRPTPAPPPTPIATEPANTKALIRCVEVAVCVRPLREGAVGDVAVTASRERARAAEAEAWVVAGPAGMAAVGECRRAGLRGMCGWCAASVTMATAPLQRGGARVAGRLEGEVATRAEEGAGRLSVSAAVQWRRSVVGGCGRRRVGGWEDLHRMKRSGVWSLGRSTSRVGGCVGREVYCWGRGGGAGVGRGGAAEGRQRLTSGGGSKTGRAALVPFLFETPKKEN